MSQIKVEQLDLLNIKEGVICHQVNCMGAAGGLAAAIFRKYPEAHKEYKTTVQSFIEDWLPLGTVNITKVDKKLYVANLYAQYDYGTDARKTEYGTFRMCIRDLISAINWHQKPMQDKNYDTNFMKNIYFPYGIGCGLGGGDWDIIKNIIKYEFADWTFNVFICNLESK